MISGSNSAISIQSTPLQHPLLLLLFLLVTLFHLLAPVSARTSCYAPDGSIITSTDYAPCINIVGVQSMCCAINSTSSPDSCAPNGLCIEPGGDQLYSRDACTDSSWASPNCLPKTTCDDAAGGSSRGSYPLRLCSDGSWCCGIANQSCCDAKQGFHLSPTLVAIGAAATSTSSNSTATASTPSNGVVAVAVGVGVGVPLAVLAFAMAGLGFWCGRRRRGGAPFRRGADVRRRSGKVRELGETDDFAAGGSGDGGTGRKEAPALELHMLPGEQNAIYEAAGGPRRFELPETSSV